MNDCFKPLSLGECNKYQNKLPKGVNFIVRNYWVYLVILIVSVSCSQTRHISDGEYLLDKTRIKLSPKELNKDELESYVKQKPNKQILGMKFHLFLYNLASADKNKGLSGWVKRIGEEPVIWNPILSERSTAQLQNYLQTKGYYSGIVSDSVSFKKARVTVCYSLQLNQPHRIASISYVFEDQNLRSYVIPDTINSLLKSGERFDKELLEDERIRIENQLRNRGFYKFSKEFIFYKAEEIPNSEMVNLEIRFKENISGIPDPNTKTRHHNRYKIKDTYIYPNYEQISGNDNVDIDTVLRDNNHVLYSGRRAIRPDPVIMPNRCVPGRLYKLDEVKKTYRNYSSLGLFRLINVDFKEYTSGLLDTSNYQYLDCHIELTPRKLQSYQTEIVGTNSAGDLGARVNVTYNNYSLLRGAENFRIQVTGAVEDMRNQLQQTSVAPMREGGIETTLTLPKFLVPFPARKFTMKYNPRTAINTAFKYQDRPDFVRTIASTSLSYIWKVNKFTKHQLYPFEFNYVRLPGNIAPGLWEEVKNTQQRTSFEDHTILSTRYTFEFTTQVIEKNTDFIYLRSNLESAGNILYTLSGITPMVSDSIFVGVPYFRYLRGDIEFQIHNQITPGNKIVYRLFTGVGQPLGYHEALPYEKLYFSGGPNSIRAWESFGLGPGSANDTTSSSSIRSTGDIKLEANIEYRFKLFWVIEGALFVDAGNTWSFNENDELQGSNFDWNRFYDEIAVGTGVGFRFDFSFLVIRSDFGFKMRDPKLPVGQRWIDSNQNSTRFAERFQFHWGIGYPF